MEQADTRPDVNFIDFAGIYDGCYHTLRVITYRIFSWSHLKCINGPVPWNHWSDTRSNDFLRYYLKMHSNRSIHRNSMSNVMWEPHWKAHACWISLWYDPPHGPLIRYVKLLVVHAPGMPGTFPRHRLQRKQLVSDPGMHHETCVTHVPWCMSGSLTRGDGENVPGIPGACANLNFTYLVRGPWSWFILGDLMPLQWRHICLWFFFLSEMLSKYIKFVI